MCKRVTNLQCHPGHVDWPLQEPRQTLDHNFPLKAWPVIQAHTHKEKRERKKERVMEEQEEGVLEELVTYSQAPASLHLSAACNQLNHTASVQRGQSLGLSHSTFTL